MAPKQSEMCIVLAVVVVLMWGGATAQSSCTTAALAGLSSCLNYVTGNASTPTSLCCSTVSTVVQMQPQCLCSLWNARGSSLGQTINQTLALQLPSVCGVPSPSLSQCNAAASGPTTSAPAPSPANPPSSSSAEPSENTPEAAAPTKPSVPSIPAGTGTGSKTVPSTNGSTSGGSNIRAPLHLVASILFIVSCASLSASF